MASLPRLRLFGFLLFLAILPLIPAAEALASAAASSRHDGPDLDSLGVEGRLRRIAGAVRERETGSAAARAIPDDVLAYVFVNGPRVGWRNGGFYNGGFRNGGFWNGGFRNGGGWRNGGFGNGGFRNGGGFRNFW
ncbi:rSAM-associated Gly-rich repeat protein [Synechococcus sp. CS-1324]|uniref:GrrA/OscA1 family cyclophane-containing rSAM-modified RiPP n=1 Tax=Synechococcus sp. CS-1324 TaxID=2847980 RepID=UPI000DB5E710|nr:GrrA/OscA1 family cyclophane-containing rSAM-modified RiPP [Synechococcus sp. CS-1324]MCT0229732.1 rSAM-associated Gly-rich repeat protein [Synechococcus sp. CS-1324]PZV02485.1 MAG: rSAM-associated Gly-rich repeat protein [Cyanobium sp.]